MSRAEDLELARTLSEKGDYDNAYALADRYLKDNPEDVPWLTIMAYCLLGCQKTTVAYHLCKRVTQLDPREPSGYMNLGMAANDLWLDKEAERHYRRGLRLSKTDKQQSIFCVNISSVLVDTGRFEEAEKYCQLALQLNPESVKAKANLGFCQLAQRNWSEGWANYRACIGSEWRPEVKYNDEPQWDGKSRGTIVLSGEQGLGDEISFASMVPDMVDWANKNDSRVIVECEPRLEGLFARSFPGVEVHGTRRKKQITWDLRKVDYSIPSGQIAEYFRTDDASFPGTPHLKPDPDRVLQWKALFKSKSKKKPVIGIAWRGGVPKTGAKFRQWDLEQLLPILRSVDAHWVSLQYRPARKEIEALKRSHNIDIVEYPHGTLTHDYDDTVAMIAAMDHVVCMQTAVTHVAGGLGIPCWVHVPKNSQWRYGSEGEDYPWAKSVRIIRQNKRGQWDDVISQTAEDLSAVFPRVSKGTGKASRKRKVRGNGADVREHGVPDHRQAPDRLSA